MKRFCCVLAVAVCLAVMCPAFASDSDYTYLTGKFEDGVYTNQTLGAEAHFGGNWHALSRKDIAALDAAASQSMANLSYPTLEELTNGELPVFYVVTNDFSDRVYISISNVGAVFVDFMTNPDIKAVADGIIKDIADGIVKNNADMGLESEGKAIRMNFLGAEQPGLYIKTTVDKRATMYQKQIMCFKDKYQFIITVESMRRDITDELLAMFKKAN